MNREDGEKRIGIERTEEGKIRRQSEEIMRDGGRKALRPTEKLP